MPEDEYETEQEQRSDGGGLRRQLEAALRDKKALEESLNSKLAEAETRGAQQAERRFQVQRTFEQLGYPKFANLWVEKHPEGELNEDDAKGWLSELGIQPGQQEQAPPQVDPEVQQAMQAFQQTTPAVSASTAYIEREEFDAMMADPNRRNDAMRAAAEGRVKLKDPRASQVSFTDSAGLFKAR